MHAVVFQVDVKEGREAASREEVGQVMDFVKGAPGFVRGTWLSDGRRAVSLIVFESEEAARQLADNASMPPDAAVTVRAVDVYEVLGEA